MCLHELNWKSETPQYTNEWYVGYKVFYKGLSSFLNALCLSDCKTYKIGCTYIDNNIYDIKSMFNFEYPTGFHIFSHRLSAEFAARLWRTKLEEGYNCSIVKLWFTDIVAEGYQIGEQVSVARTMYLVEEVA